MNKQQLASKIWMSANKMRSKIEANEYKDYILGFMFYKFLCERELRFLKKNGLAEEDIKELTEEDAEVRDYILRNVGYFIEYKNLFSTWIDMGSDFSVAHVRDALSAFSRLISPSHRDVFDGIFDTLQTGLSKLGSTTGAQTKAVQDLIHLLDDIPMDGKQDYDVLGYIYEYLISNFAANAGKKAGEFYTPKEVSILMSEIIAYHLRGKKQIDIYDPTSGSGSLLIHIGQAVAQHNNNKESIKYFAQELKENTYNLTRMNLIMRDIKPSNIVARNADTLEDDWPMDPQKGNRPLYVDAVVSNPPYSQHWDPSGKENDLRYSYGLAPRSKADYAFLLHDLYHLRPEGIMTIVLPHGVLFRGGEEGEIRKNLIENYHIETIIGLPPNIFFGTGIPTIIMVLRQKRKESDVLFIDASKHFKKEGKNNVLRSSDIKRIVDTVIERKDIEKFSRKVSLQEIRENEYNLNIPRYIDSTEPTETWDIYASMNGGIPKNELQALEEYWNAWPNIKDKLFADNGSPYLDLQVQDVEEAVLQHPDVVAYKRKFKNTFNDLNQVVTQKLIANLPTVNVLVEKEAIGKEIFKKLKGVPLVDKYDAYQAFDDAWSKIALDIEIIQSEGETAVTSVGPNMVSKTKNGKEVEVQEGWQGRVIPLSLVQTELMPEQVKALDNKETELSQVSSDLSELIESIDAEEKDSPVFNEAGDKFIVAELNKAIKEINKKDMTEFESQLLEGNKLRKRESALKKEIKELEEQLHIRSKEKLESLSLEEGLVLLEKKWLTPLSEGLRELSNDVVDHFISEIEKLAKKYETTLADIDREIKETEDKLVEMLKDLEGNEYDMKGIKQLISLLGGE